MNEQNNTPTEREQIRFLVRMLIAILICIIAAALTVGFVIMPMLG